MVPRALFGHLFGDVWQLHHSVEVLDAVALWVPEALAVGMVWNKFSLRGCDHLLGPKLRFSLLLAY